MFTPESCLEAMVLQCIATTKDKHACWSDPKALAQSLGVRVIHASLGENWEGATHEDVIVLDTKKGSIERQRFTWFHEITHILIRRYDELYSILHEQYVGEQEFTRIRERLCDIGAAEFLMPRQQIRALFGQSRYSLACLEAVSATTGASRTAVCIQLARCAPHRCAVVVCQSRVIESSSPMLITDVLQLPVLCVVVSMASPSMKYLIARGTVISQNHLLFEAYQAKTGCIVHGQAPLLFKRQDWVVHCEGVRLGSQVFGLFQVDEPPFQPTEQISMF
jgi:IrrE N-terminal-like domain